MGYYLLVILLGICNEDLIYVWIINGIVMILFLFVCFSCIFDENEFEFFISLELRFVFVVSFSFDKFEKSVFFVRWRMFSIDIVLIDGGNKFKFVKNKVKKKEKKKKWLCFFFVIYECKFVLFVKLRIL